LKVGDRIRVVEYPPDFQQPGFHVHDETAEIYRHLIAEKAILTVSRIDETGYPWVEFTRTNDIGETEWHSLMVNHDGLEKC
jgi:hypothetical protein